MSNPRDFVIDVSGKSLLLRQPTASRSLEIFQLIYQPLQDLSVLLKESKSNPEKLSEYGLKMVQYYGYLLYETCEDPIIQLPRTERRFIWESDKFQIKTIEEALSIGQCTFDAFVDAGFDADDIKDIALKVQDKLLETNSAIEDAGTLKKNGSVANEQQNLQKINRKQRRAARHTTQSQA